MFIIEKRKGQKNNNNYNNNNKGQHKTIQKANTKQQINKNK